MRLSGFDLGLDNAFQRSVLDVQDIGKQQVCRDPFTEVGHDDDAALRKGSLLCEKSLAGVRRV